MATATVTANVPTPIAANASTLAISRVLGGGSAISAVYGASSSFSGMNSSIESAGIS
jgi:hypothetical protein